MAKSQYANWYADRKWRAKRAAQLQREPLCRYCQAQGKVTPADVADHIEPHRGDRAKFYGGALQSLCHHCHSSVKQREESGKPSRLDLRNDPHSHWNR